MTISPELEQITKTCTETQKTPNSRTTLRKKNKAMKSHNSLISHQLQSYSNQNNMVLAQTGTCISGAYRAQKQTHTYN